MWATKQFLALSKQLFDAGLRFDLRPGAALARGFADMGEEEFILLPGRKLLSSYTGKLSTLEAEAEKFFYVLPTVSEMTDKLQRLNYDIDGLVFAEQREWRLQCHHIESERIIIEQHAQLECVFALTLFKSLSES